MNIPSEVDEFCQQKLGRVTEFKPASGGCINNGGKITSDSGVYFLKWNYAEKFPLMFTAEANGLSLLSQPDCIKIPDVLYVEEGEEYSCIIMEYIASTSPASSYWTDLAHAMACIHRTSRDHYGLDHNNYMGSLSQCNEDEISWLEFFINHRLKPQLELAKENNRLTKEELKKFDDLHSALPNLLNEEKPTLIHGDLWNGNIMIGSSGEPVLIDPAVAYAHREMDIAMTKLFGGFDSQFYNAYNEAYPLEPGYVERMDIYNLYPLLVHVNLFGGNYASQTMSIVSKFT